MCYAIVEVKYKANSIADDLIKLDDETALINRVEALKNNEQVDRIRVFTQRSTYSRVSTWAETPNSQRTENMKCALPKSPLPSDS